MFLSGDVMGLPTATSARRQHAALSIAGGRQSVFQSDCVGGLYGRTRKRSVQPQIVREDANSMSSEDHDDRVHTMSTCKQAPRKTPPPNDSTTKVIAGLEPANLPPLPPSPIPSAVSQVVSEIGCDTTALVQEVRQHQRSMAVEGHQLLKNTQGHVDNGCISHENNGARYVPETTRAQRARAPCAETVSAWMSSSTLTACEVQSMDK
ncbi:hypothetical protein JB92DRAFT_2951181 [Gautieria morchelliformis]|nr:hypothetical protein JB92DRAFT_2951181 [Gautieria morchelliformis]